MSFTFSVITPSFRQLEWLKLCAASVADQQGVECEHIVQDAGTGPELAAWAATRPNVRLFVEKDKGMYDAVNRGLRRATGEFLAYLNCDEQYLPGTLEVIRKFFHANPDVEVVFADAVVVDASGAFICHRKAVLPQKLHTLVSANLATLTCATFFRRSIIEKHKAFFDPDAKVVGDGKWVIELLDRRVKMAVLRHFTSAFAETGENASTSEQARRETSELLAGAPSWARTLRSMIILHFRFRRLLGGAYFQEPFRYAIYTSESPGTRRTFEVSRPTFRWRR